MTAVEAVPALASVDDLFTLEPLDRFEALIAARGFDEFLRAETILFPHEHPIFGTSCGVANCEGHSTQAVWWCTAHNDERLAAKRDGIGEAEWLASAKPKKRGRSGKDGRRPCCRFCPDRDAATGDLCRIHQARLVRHRNENLHLDEDEWASTQSALPGTGACRVPACRRRAELLPSLCPNHRASWWRDGQPDGVEMDRWLAKRHVTQQAGAVSLAALPPMVASEIRYGLWAHTRHAAPARWHPMWIRTLVTSCERTEASSLLELDPSNRTWTTQPASVNRILKTMLTDIRAIHHTRDDTRALGVLDTEYWGFRFPDRRSPFDLTAIRQRWMRDLTWDYLAWCLDQPDHVRTAGSFEQARRTMVCFSTFLADCSPNQGESPHLLSASTAREFVADYRRRIENKDPVRGVYRVDGTPSRATKITYSIMMNALRRVLRWALDSGTVTHLGLPSDLVAAIPAGGTTHTRNPRPFSDSALRQLSDPGNHALLAEADMNDMGIADMWAIQIKCGRRIGEIIELRLDCISEHLGRTWMWVDMTKVDKLDYAIQIPKDIFDLIRNRQSVTIDRYERRHGTEPTAGQRRRIALFPSRVTNPTFERSVSGATFSTSFNKWLDRIGLIGRAHV